MAAKWLAEPSTPLQAPSRHDMTDLEGRAAPVTGASRGIGRAVALTLARAGLHVAINYRTRTAEARAVVREIEAAGRRALAVQADVARASRVARLVARVRKVLGPIDVLVNNAGSARPQPWRDIREPD
jgi:3-oxoacyl-[acyl-carrier protein] reductase